MKSLLAIIVNHRSGAFCVRCVQSLKRAWSLEGRASADLRVVVVDTASGHYEEPWLGLLETEGAEVVRSSENLGYAGGMNLGYRYALSEGGAPESEPGAVALLNPDLHFTAGSIEPLLEELERDASCGAVGPRMSVDEAQTLHHPSLDLPHVADEVVALQARFDRPALRARLARRARSAAAFYQCEAPRAVQMLSGACVVMRSETVRALGAPMDEAYPLYYEDAQLAQDLRAIGLSSKIVPASRVLHHWSRSAGSGEDFAGEPARRAAVGRALFHARHGNEDTARALQETEELLARSAVELPFELKELGVQSEAPLLDLPREREVLLEISACPFFPLAAGAVVSGGERRLGDALWGWLFPGRWYVRAACARTGRHLGAWSFEKHQPTRTAPVELGGADATIHAIQIRPETREAA
ncbi:MAG: glycosyltransferase family 2 protein [Planctomycetes bacterium]|nr:glycosyltransferase family 2 protein [Planctomycetota bacterium]